MTAWRATTLSSSLTEVPPACPAPCSIFFTYAAGTKPCCPFDASTFHQSWHKQRLGHAAVSQNPWYWKKLENSYEQSNLNFHYHTALSSMPINPHQLLALSYNVQPGEGTWPTGPTTKKLQALMTSRAEKGTKDLGRWRMFWSVWNGEGRGQPVAPKVRLVQEVWPYQERKGDVFFWVKLSGDKDHHRVEITTCMRDLVFHFTEVSLSTLLLALRSVSTSPFFMGRSLGVFAA